MDRSEELIQFCDELFKEMISKEEVENSKWTIETFFDEAVKNLKIEKENILNAVENKLASFGLDNDNDKQLAQKAVEIVYDKQIDRFQKIKLQLLEKLERTNVQEHRQTTL